MQHNSNIENTTLVAFSEFKQAAKMILSMTKEESDKQMAEFQKENRSKKKNQTT